MSAIRGSLALTADIEIPAIEPHIAGTLESHDRSVDSNDGRIAVGRYMAHEEFEHFAATLITILSG